MWRRVITIRHPTAHRLFVSQSYTATAERRYSSMIDDRPSANNRVLVLGSNGQVGSRLVSELCESYGTECVLAADISQISPRLRLGKEGWYILPIHRRNGL